MVDVVEDKQFQLGNYHFNESGMLRNESEGQRDQ